MKRKGRSMNVVLRGLKIKKRTATIAAWGLMVASPFVLLLGISLAIGRNAFDSTPLWTDELDYWRAIFSWLHVGFNAGYSGIGELTAPMGVLSVHGLSPFLLYGLPAKVFGWSYGSIVLYNCLWVSLGALTFCLLNRPKAGTAVWLSVALMVYTPAILYASTSMTELANYGLLLFYLAFVTRLAYTRRVAREALGQVAPLTKGLPSLLLSVLVVTLCCAYRITYIGLWIPLILVACDYRWSAKMFTAFLAAGLLSLFIYYITALFASPFATGFLYNLLRTDSLSLAARMFLSHGKANLIDYFISTPANVMESLQRVLYTGVAVLTLLGSFVRMQKTEGKLRLHFGFDRFSLLSFLMLFLPFAIVICAYETNDWSDYRTLSPFLWVTLAAAIVHGRRLIPALYVAGCAAILAVLLSTPPVGAFNEPTRYEQEPFTTEMQELCANVVLDPDAVNPFTNTVRCDLFTYETVASLNPGIGIETGWFTSETVGKSNWILTDHLKIPVEGYKQVFRNDLGYVYRLTTSYE